MLDLKDDPKAWAAALQDQDPCKITAPDENCAVVAPAAPWNSKEAKTSLEAWSDEVTKVRQACITSTRRQCELEHALNAPARGNAATECSGSAFVGARAALDLEMAHFKTLEDKSKRLVLGKRDTLTFAGYGAIDLIVAAMSLWFLTVTAGPLLRNRLSLIANQRNRLQWLFVGIGVLFGAIAMVMSRMHDSTKLWVGIDTYGVSHAYWWCNVVVMVGVATMFAQPMTLAWVLSRRALIPRLMLTAPRGDCGVGRYVSFLQIWSMIAFAFTLLPVIIFVRYLDHAQTSLSSSPYLIPVFAGMAITGVLVWRLVSNALVIRSRYAAAVSRLATTWAAVRALEPTPDPTIPFIGENWWKLPATLGSIALTFWTLLEWTGVAKPLVSALLQ